MIIGLTGRNAAGKGEIAGHLKAKGFHYFSLSDVLREEAESRDLEKTRDNLITLGNKLREEKGAGVLAQGIREKISEMRGKNAGQDFVVDSIRNPEEAKELMKEKDFLLVGVDAPAGLRFERLLKRGRIGDAQTLEQFREQEDKENTSNSSAQQLDATYELAGKKITNDKSLEELHKKVDNLLKELKKATF